MRTSHIYILLLLYLSIAANISAYDTTIHNISIPVFSITTDNGEDPQGYPVYPPEGGVGVGLAGNEYLTGRLVVTQKNDTLYDSGEYQKDVSGMRVRQRGNTSALYSKKPYKIKLSKKADLFFRGNDSSKDKDWLLLRDGLSMNIPVGLKTSEIVGQEWTSSYAFVNLVINGDYKGCYILAEPIEIEEHRCNLSDTGFILEDDAYWWNEDYYFKGSLLPTFAGYTIKSPDLEDIPLEKLAEIELYINHIESLLAGGSSAAEYLDLDSFTKWLLAHDILGTLDAAGSNRYLTKYDFDHENPTASPLKMGPIWDFDDIFKRPDNWAQVHNGNYRFYYKYLLQDSVFYNKYTTLWDNISPTLCDEISEMLQEICDSIGNELDICRDIDNKRWNRATGNSVADDIAFVNGWFCSRVSWISKNIVTSTDIPPVYIEKTEELHDVYSLSGQLLYHKISHEQCNRLPRGIYIINGRKVVVK